MWLIDHYSRPGSVLQMSHPEGVFGSHQPKCYRCPLCEKNFTRSDNVGRHMRTCHPASATSAWPVRASSTRHGAVWSNNTVTTTSYTSTAPHVVDAVVQTSAGPDVAGHGRRSQRPPQ